MEQLYAAGSYFCFGCKAVFLYNCLEVAVPAPDRFHQAVKAALTKDGWTITHDPFLVSIGLLNLYVDLGAEKLIGAEREGQYIAVEVKSFINPSAISEFHSALGQFLNYKVALEIKEPGRELFLAVPLETYEEFFSQPLIQAVSERFDLKLLIYDPEIEEVAQWKK